MANRAVRVRYPLIALLGAVLLLGLPMAAPAGAESDTTNPPPGANDWNCKPSAAHPNPVVLVHGTGATMAGNWSQLSPVLAAEGYCVFALNYGRRPDHPPPFDQTGGLIPMEDSAVELGAFIDEVLAATGATKVDIVGHSQGSLMPNYYAKFLDGVAHIDRYVGITPLWDGTDFLFLATLSSLLEPTGAAALGWSIVEPFCQSCPQFFAGSAFIEKMNEGGGPRVAGISYTMIMTRYDQLVWPYTSGIMDGAVNIVVQDQCPADLSEHAAMAFDPVVHQNVLNALDPANATPIACGGGGF